MALSYYKHIHISSVCMEVMGFKKTWVQILAPGFIYVILNKSINLSKPRFPHSKKILTLQD